MPMPIHVVAVQYATDTHNRSENYNRALRLLDDAAHVADLVVMPQFSFSRFWPGMTLAEVAEPMPGPYTAVVSQVAATRNAYICYTGVEREGNSFYSTAVLIGGDGALVGKHRKTLLSEGDLLSGFSGGARLDVYPTSIGRIAIALDTEAMNARYVQLLRARGADIVLSPCSASAVPPETLQSTVDHWRAVLVSNAQASRSYIVWANKIGEERGFDLAGSSMVVDPQGIVLADGSSDQEEFVRCRIVLASGGAEAA